MLPGVIGRVSTTNTKAMWHRKRRTCPRAAKRNQQIILQPKTRRREEMINRGCAECKLSLCWTGIPWASASRAASAGRENWGKELFIGKPDIDNFYHCLHLPEQLRRFFGLPPTYTINDKKKCWPGLFTVLAGRSHSAISLQAKHGESLLTGVSLNEKEELREGNFQSDLSRRFGR